MTEPKTIRVGIDGRKFPEAKQLGAIGLLERCAELGHDGVFFRTVLDFVPDLDAGRLREIRRRADELGLYLEMGLGKINPYNTAEAPEIRIVGKGDYLLGMRRMIEALADIDCIDLWADTANYQGHDFGLFAIDRYRTDVDWPDQLEATTKFAGKLAPILRDHGAALAVETHEEITTHELARMIETVGPEVMGVTLDLANVVTRGEDPIAATRRVAPYVRKTHMRDWVIFPTAHGLERQIRACGDGLIDWREVMALLRDAGTTGPTSPSRMPTAIVTTSRCLTASGGLGSQTSPWRRKSTICCNWPAALRTRWPPAASRIAPPMTRPMRERPARKNLSPEAPGRCGRPRPRQTTAPSRRIALEYPLKVIVIAAHPDEAEMYAGGTVRLLADRGAAVKFMSLTNGDAGHYEMERVPLKRRRAREAYAAARHLGVVDYEILDIHDGDLVPDLALRKAVISAICRWQADLVITFHNDCPGHLDNRAAGSAVHDAVGFCTNANIVGDLPPLAPVASLPQNDRDYGAVPTHRHDIVVDNDGSIDAKLHACADHATQFFEFAPFERGFIGEVPKNGSWADERNFILKHWPEFMYALDAMRPNLIDRYGEQGKATQFAESFQLADYGRQASVPDVYDLLSL